jgi:hypothetical protein
VPDYFEEGKEYIAYTADNLETLLDYYLEHEDERQAIAGAGQRRAQAYGFGELWQKAVDSFVPELAAKKGSDKGDRPHLCEAPSGPFRQMGSVPFFAAEEALLLRAWRNKRQQYSLESRNSGLWSELDAPKFRRS